MATATRKPPIVAPRKKAAMKKAVARLPVDPEESGRLEDDELVLDMAGSAKADPQLACAWKEKRKARMRVGAHVQPREVMPTTPEELERCLRDPKWRLFSGCLYKIIIKGDGDDDEDLVVPFLPNRAQRRFIETMWHRNIILKARQLGFTTLIAIMWLDEALFNGNTRCGMIAQDRETAEAIFRDKVVFAYDNLPDEIRERFPLARASTKELLFGHNNSSIRVATSVRGGTIHRLHVSEFGKICAKFPAKADEVVTGSIQAVPKSGILVIESTAEGTSGEFYEMCQRAMALVVGRVMLTASQYRFHFFAWWQDPNYDMDPSGVHISQELHDYFDEVEISAQTKIDLGQRAWYAEKMRNDFSGSEERMWREYPSTPEEAFQQSTEGHYYTKDLVLLRKRGGIRELPLLDLPVHTFWDIGTTDGTAIWFMQILDGQDRFIGYYEEHDEDLKHYATMLLNRGYTFGTHFLPHDANQKKLTDTNKSVKQLLQALLPGHRFRVVPVITKLMTGIYQVRKHLKGAYFDLDGTKQGIERVSGYKKKFSTSENRYIDQPDKSNGCSEGADALRQWAQAKELGYLARIDEDDEHGYVEPEASDWRTA